MNLNLAPAVDRYWRSRRVLWAWASPCTSTAVSGSKALRRTSANDNACSMMRSAQGLLSSSQVAAMNWASQRALSAPDGRLALAGGGICQARRRVAQMISIWRLLGRSSSASDAPSLACQVIAGDRDLDDRLDTVAGRGRGDVGLGPAVEGGADHHVPVVFQLLDDAAQATQPPRAFCTSGGSLLAHRTGDHNMPVTHEGKHAGHGIC